jgi:hypothetical protein
LDRSGAVRSVEAIGCYRRVADLIVDIDDGSGETTITADRPERVRVRGMTLVGSVDASTSVSGSLGDTYPRSERSNELAGGYSAPAGIRHTRSTRRSTSIRRVCRLARHWR